MANCCRPCTLLAKSAARSWLPLSIWKVLLLLGVTTSTSTMGIEPSAAAAVTCIRLKPRREAAAALWIRAWPKHARLQLGPAVAL